MRDLRTTVLLFALLVCCICQRIYSQSIQPGMLHVADASYAAALWKGFDENKQLVFRYENSEHVIAPDRLIAWQPQEPMSNPRGEAVVLVDGSVLTGLIAVLRDDTVRIQTSLFGLVTLAKTQVAAILLDASANNAGELYRLWIRDSSQGDDTIYLRDGLNITGVIKTVGTSTLLRLSNTQAVETEVDAHIIQTSISRISAIRFSPILFPIDTKTVGTIYDFADGTHLVTKSGQIKDQKLAIVTAAGVNLTASDRQSCVDLCVGIFGDHASASGWKIVNESDVIETRGQSPWTRNRWVYFETPRASGWFSGADQIRLRVVPSVRIKFRNQSSWEKIVGSFQIIPITRSETATSDALGNKVQSNPQRVLDESPLSVRMIAVADGKLVDLWKSDPSSSEQLQPFSVDISKYSEFYVLVENSNIFSTPTEIVFDRMRFSQ